MKTIGILLLSSLLILSVSCFRIEQYPDEPSIELISFTYADTVDILDNNVLRGTLHFSFVDGDGDIGFDTTSPQQNPIFLEKYKYINGVLTPVTLQVPQSYYVPLFEPEGNNKTLKGEIFVNEIDEKPPYNGDTVVYKFYIIDRAGNVSNVESTGDMILQ